MPGTTELNWRKSTRSGDKDCVEVAFLPGGGAVVRDSKDQHGAVLTFTQPEWDAFLAGARAGEFDQV